MTASWLLGNAFSAGRSHAPHLVMAYTASFVFYLIRRVRFHLPPTCFRTFVGYYVVICHRVKWKVQDDICISLFDRLSSPSREIMGHFLTLLSCLLFLPIRSVIAQINTVKCAALKHSLRLENTTIIDAAHVSAKSNVTTPGTCQSSAAVTSALCRVQAVVNTSSTSAVHFEVWMPDQWFGRFLGLGNGGLAGCK